VQHVGSEVRSINACDALDRFAHVHITSEKESLNTGNHLMQDFLRRAQAAAASTLDVVSNAASSTAAFLSSYTQTSRLPNEEESAVSLQVRSRMQTQFDPALPQHAALLSQLQLACDGLAWQQVGFQSPNPGSDFRGGGVLSLENLVFFVTRMPVAALSMMHRRKDRTIGSSIDGVDSANYPWAAVGINITRMIAELTGACTAQGTAPKQQQSRRNWSFLIQPLAFQRLYCSAFIIFDNEWDRLKAGYLQTPVVLASTRERMLQLWETSATLEELESRVSAECPQDLALW
jgi:hypothetical protein